MEIAGFKECGQKLLSAYRIAWQSIEALKEVCRHPRETIVNEPDKTYCDECTTVLWPSGSQWQKFVELSPADRADIRSAVQKFQDDKTRLAIEIAVFQKACPHPDGEKLPDHNPGGFNCGICDLLWSKVLEKRDFIEAHG